MDKDRAELSKHVTELLSGAAKMHRPCLVANRRDVERLSDWKATFADLGISVKVNELVPERQMYLMDEGVFVD